MTKDSERRPSQELPPVTESEKVAFQKKILGMVRNPRVFTLPQHIHPNDEIDHQWGTEYQKGNITVKLIIPVPGVKNYTGEKYEAEVRTLISTSPKRDRVKYQTLALINGELDYKEKTEEYDFDDEGNEVKKPYTETTTDFYDIGKGLEKLRTWMASPPDNHRKEYEEMMRILNTLGPEDEIRDREN